MDWFVKTYRDIQAAFSYAIEGIGTCIKGERNFRIELLVAVIVISMAYYFQVTQIEWLLLILSIGMVLAMELVNSAIEKTVDMYCNNIRHPLAKQAKDMAAAAVLVVSIAVAIVGVIIFVPYVFS
ncbi:diacylglycerol kinase [Hutsoniella sourekii]